MFFRKIDFLILSSIFLVIFSPNSSYAKELTKHVVIISIDGLRPDVLLKTNTPYLNEQWKRGSYSFNAQTIVPSLTLPSHTSMLTGMPFLSHKVDWNDYNPNKSITTKTIFEYAKDKKLTTAMFVAKEKFKHFNKGKSVDFFSYPAYDYNLVLDSAEKYIFTNKPNLSFIHLAEIDGTGHVFGWNSDTQKSMLEKMDKPIGIFLKNLRSKVDDIVVIITSDHGGHFLTHGTDMPVDTTIPWIVRGKIIKSGFKIEKEIHTYDTTATALWLLGVEEKNIYGKAVKDILDK